MINIGMYLGEGVYGRRYLGTEYMREKVGEKKMDRGPIRMFI